MMSNPNPGFVPEGVYDSVKFHNEKLRRQVEILTEENDELKKACTKLQTNQGFVKASDVSADEQDGEAKITDQKMLTDFVMNSLKLRPKQVIIKYRGSIVVEISPR